MKKIINWSLVLLSIFSIGIALKYSALPVLGFLPDGIARFWITTPEEQQKYVLLYDVSVGFILSAIFYFIVDEIPDQVRRYKAKRLLNSHVNQLLENMEQLISVVIAKYERNSNLKALAPKDFLCLNGETKLASEEVSFSTATYYRKNGKKKTAIKRPSTISNLVKSNLAHIVRKIGIIKNYEYFYATDDALVECIRNIECCDLVKYYLKDGETGKEKTPCFRLHGTNKAMDEFIQLYLKLKALNYHTEYSVTQLDSKAETEKYRTERESGTLLMGVLALQDEHKTLANDNPTVVIYGGKYTTKILVTELVKNIIAVPQTIEEASKKDLSGYKYAILLLDSSSIQSIISIIKKGHLPPNIVLLTERNILPKRFTYWQRKFGLKIVAELYFKSTVQISALSIIFNRQEPSEKNIADISKKVEDIIYGKHY